CQTASAALVDWTASLRLPAALGRRAVHARQSQKRLTVCELVDAEDATARLPVCKPPRSPDDVVESVRRGGARRLHAGVIDQVVCRSTAVSRHDLDPAGLGMTVGAWEIG